MHHPSGLRLRAALAFCLLGAGALAQRPVVIVGGPAPQYTDLPPAVAAAPPGAILFVHPGVYTGFTTNKPLRIHLAFDATTGVVQPALGATHTITVNGLPPGDQFVVFGSGAAVMAGSVGAIRVANCVASVLLEGLTVAANGPCTALDVQLSTGVLTRRCVFGGTPAMTAQQTSFCASECVFFSPGGAGAIAFNTQFESVRTFFTSTNAPTVRLTDCVSRFASDGSTAITVLGPGTTPIAALEATNGVLQFDPATLGLWPIGGAPGYQTVNTLLAITEVPTLTSMPAPPGGTASVSMSTSVLRPGVIVLGQLASVPAVFEYANIWVDTLVAPLVVTGGLCGPMGLSSQVAIPNSPTFRGEVFCLQGITWDPTWWPVLSGPGLWTML